MTKFVDVSSKATGKKLRVPEHFLGIPSIGDNFKLTPKARAAKKAAAPQALETSDSAPADEPTPTPASGDTTKE